MRTATCTCGQLSIVMEGEPDAVLICHCRACQKATGGPFGVGTYWPASAVAEIRGRSSSYARHSDAGRTLTNHFCPTCGGRLFWYADFVPHGIGVAIGNFESADFPAPTDEYWTVRKRPWVEFSCSPTSHPGDD